MFLPARTPREMVERLHQETLKALARRACRRISRIRQSNRCRSRRRDAQIKSEIDSIIALVKAAGIKLN
jgi:tripartite-type tricarboxylate transporter receptor subunit TctC